MIKAVILAGGLGTRISEESHMKPKPMIEIGGRPILWHIMKTYSHFGVNDFIICCGYRGYQIKEYFANYFLHTSDVTFDLANNEMKVHQQRAEAWKVTLVDTGELTQTGGRVKRIRDHLNDTFCLTYGDGVSNIILRSLLSFQEQKCEVTVSAVQPEGRFGSLEIDDKKVSKFLEKPKGDGQWVSGGFMVCEPSVIERIDDDKMIFEKGPLISLANDANLRCANIQVLGNGYAAIETILRICRREGALESLV